MIINSRDYWRMLSLFTAGGAFEREGPHPPFSSQERDKTGAIPALIASRCTSLACYLVSGANDASPTAWECRAGF